MSIGARLRGAGNRLLSLVRPKRGRTDAPSTEPAVGAPAPTPVTTIFQHKDPLTLDASKVLNKLGYMAHLKKGVMDLAHSYRPGNMSELFAETGRAFSELFDDFRARAAETLVEAREMYQKAEVPDLIDINAATAELKTDLKPLVAKRLDAMEALKAKVAAAKAEYRRLTIGITGNPAIMVKAAAVGFALMLPVAAAFAVSLYFEVVFNVPILQDEGDRNMAIAFSLLVSLAGSITTLMAGMAKRGELDHRNAKAENRVCFPEGVDPETKKPATVFPMSGDAKFKSRLWHSLTLFVIVGTLAIRYIMMKELADIAGSFGVVLVFLVLYGWEAMYAEVTHPLASECLKKKEEAEGVEAELKVLEGSTTSPEARKAFDVHTGAIAASESAARAKAKNRKEAADTFRRIASEYSASPLWFKQQYAGAIQDMLERIGDVRTENDGEIVELSRQAAPEFSITDLPFDLEAEMQAASMVSTSLETEGKKMTPAEFDGLIKTLTAELVREREEAARLSAAEDRAGRARAAEEAARVAPSRTINIFAALKVPKLNR